MEERKRVTAHEETEKERVAIYEQKQSIDVNEKESHERTLVNLVIEAQERVRVALYTFEEYWRIHDELQANYEATVSNPELTEIDTEVRLKRLKDEEMRFSKSIHGESMRVNWHAASEQARAHDFYEKVRTKNVIVRKYVHSFIRPLLVTVT